MELFVVPIKPWVCEWIQPITPSPQIQNDRTKGVADPPTVIYRGGGRLGVLKKAKGTLRRIFKNVHPVLGQTHQQTGAFRRVRVTDKVNSINFKKY